MHYCNSWNYIFIQELLIKLLQSEAVEDLYDNTTGNFTEESHPFIQLTLIVVNKLIYLDTQFWPIKYVCPIKKDYGKPVKSLFFSVINTYLFVLKGVCLFIT